MVLEQGPFVPSGQGSWSPRSRFQELRSLVAEELLSAVA